MSRSRSRPSAGSPPAPLPARADARALVGGAVFALVLAGFVAFAVAQAPGPAAVAPTPAGAAGTSATPQGSCPSGLAAQAVSCSEVHGVQRPEPEIAGDEPNPGGVLAPSGVTLP